MRFSVSLVRRDAIRHTNTCATFHLERHLWGCSEEVRFSDYFYLGRSTLCPAFACGGPGAAHGGYHPVAECAGHHPWRGQCPGTCHPGYQLSLIHISEPHETRH